MIEDLSRFQILAIQAIANAARGRMALFGGLDTAALSRVDAARVPDMVRDLYSIFSPFEGGYIFSPDNSIMPDTPVENVRELFRAVREFGRS